MGPLVEDVGAEAALPRNASDRLTMKRDLPAGDNIAVGRIAARADR